MKEKKDLFDEMAEHYGKHGLPVKNDMELNNGGDMEAMVLAYMEEDDGFYDGHDEDLCPWQFDMRDLNASGDPVTDISILLCAWHDEGETFSYVPLDNWGFTHLIVYEGFIYKIEISDNMGLESIDKIGKVGDY